MANKANGNDFKLYIGSVGSGTLLAHATSTGFTSASSIVDVTDKDSSGSNREILASAGIITKTITIQGIYSDDASASRGTIQTNHDAQTVDSYYLQYPIMNSSNNQAGTDAFSAKITQLDATGEVGGEMTFSATFEVSGAVTTVAETTV